MNITKKNNCIEIIFFIIFCISVIILSLFHEPWYDEFQAWEISKDSIYNILFVIPHFEGHPPFWHLILKCFSHFNVNPELGIRIPNLIFMFGAVWLLIFKSPFSRSIKLLLPFTYFIFYQYSIINRPYSIFCFAMFLAAVFYKERNEHPFRFILALALLCLSNAYGMVVAAGIIIAWFIEIIYKQNFIKFFKTFIKDKRFYAMFLIFILCLVLIAIIFPDNKVLYNAILKSVAFCKRILYSFLIFPIDSLFYNMSDYSINANIDDDKFKLFWGCVLGIFTNLFLLYIFKKFKKLLLFIIPYSIILIMFLCLYASSHHIGLLMIFYIFSFWCAFSNSEIKINQNIKKLLCCIIAFVICVQLYWSLSAAFHEIIYPYSSSRNITVFIKQNNLYRYKIMARLFEPPYYVNVNTGKIYNENNLIPEEERKNYQEVFVLNALGQNIAVVINPYFNRNIVYSFGFVNQNKQYCILRQKTTEEIIETKEKIRMFGVPDIILNQNKPEGIFSDEELNGINYILLKGFPNYHIWKDKYRKYYSKIYIRSDLYDKIKNEQQQKI